MGRTFRKIVLCSTDDFPPSKNDKIQGWVENNGGTFLKEMAPNVTHLVASPKAWKRYVPIVKQARRLKTVKIVNLSWLEDSLTSKTRKPLSTEKYDWEHRHWSRKARRVEENGSQTNEVGLAEKCANQEARGWKDDKIKAAGEVFDKACYEFEATAKATGYHIYNDPTHFPYSIILVRTDIHTSRLEKHNLKMYESDEEPRTYAAFTTYLATDGTVRHDTVAPWGSGFELAEDCFRTFFRLRTGVSWESRPLELNEAARKNGEEDVDRKRALSQDGAGDFVYVPLSKSRSKVKEWKVAADAKDGSKPSVTMVISEEAARGREDVRPMTPEGGW